LLAHEMLRGTKLLPIHWGTFDLALHTWDAPGEELVQLARARNAKLLLPRLGQPLEPSRDEEPTPWWRELTRHERKP
jgi:hypothetical protein